VGFDVHKTLLSFLRNNAKKILFSSNFRKTKVYFQQCRVENLLLLGIRNSDKYLLRINSVTVKFPASDRALLKGNKPILRPILSD
jgi:hypothetical protein